MRGTGYSHGPGGSTGYSHVPGDSTGDSHVPGESTGYSHVPVEQNPTMYHFIHSVGPGNVPNDNERHNHLGYDYVVQGTICKR